MARFRGLTRPRRSGQEVAGAVYLARLEVPDDVRAIAQALPLADPRRLLFIGPSGSAKRELLESTGHADPREAARVAEPIIARWRGAIAGLRQTGNPESVADALALIEAWRSDEVARAQGFGSEVAFQQYRLASDHQRRSVHVEPPAPGVEAGGAAWAAMYFQAHPEASREVEVPFDTFQLLDRLGAVETAPERWREIDGFDAHLTREIGALDSRVKATVRPAFARAWRSAVEAREVERRHAAALLKVIGDASGSAAIVAPLMGYTPRAGDKTVGQLIDAYQAAKPSKDNVAPARAVREFIGQDTPIRAVTRDDARRFAAFVLRIPINVAQQRRYRGLTLEQAVEAGEKASAPRLSATTAGTYLRHAAMIWNWGLREGDGWADDNPFRGLAEGGGEPEVKRRGFTNAELVTLFARLQRHKEADSYLFWAPALLLNGARLSEVCQLRTDDVREIAGVPYLDISLRDVDGRLDPMKSVKNSGSIRLAPIHPLALDAGFMAFVDRRRAAKAERLFGDVKPYWNKRDGEWDWSHYPSRALNAEIDVTLGDQPGLVVHSFRHGFRTWSEAADLAESVIDAIGGWSQKTVGRRYGERDVAMLAKNLARVDYGGLKL